MNRFINEFWNPLSRTEKIEFSVVVLFLLNLIVGLAFIVLSLL